MSIKCDDCGCYLLGGVCENCDEELFIFENQYEYLPEELSDDFSNKVKEQRESLNE